VGGTRHPRHVGLNPGRALHRVQLACGHCGGRLRLIATLHDPAVIRKILAHLALAHSGQSPGPAPPESGAATS
jgi:hypothetical protein